MTMEFADIDTRRCRITPLQSKDAAALQVITDSSVTACIHFLPEPFTLADAKALIARSGDDHRFFGIRDAAGTKLRGVIGVHKRRAQEIEIGYWLSAAARGKGLASEAVRAMVARLAFTCPDCHIVAECDPDNRASWALLRRAGFTLTGEPGDRPGRMLLAWSPEAINRIDVC